jgi:hypothetical protein
MTPRIWTPALVLVAALLAAAPLRAQEDSELSRAVEESYPTNLSMLRDAANAAVSEMLLNFGPPRGSSIRLEAENAHEARWFLENLLLDRLTEAGYEVYLQPTDSPPSATRVGGGRPGSVTPEPAEAATEEALSMADAIRVAEERGREDGEDAREEEAAAVGDTVPEVVEGMIGEPAGAAPDTLGMPAVSDSGAVAPLRARIPADYLLRFRVVECAVTYPKSYRKSPLGGRTVERLASVNVYATLVQESRERVIWVGHGDSERLDHVPASKLPLLEGSTFPFTQPELESRGLGAYVEPILVLGIVAGLIYLFYSNQ